MAQLPDSALSKHTSISLGSDHSGSMFLNLLHNGSYSAPSIPPVANPAAVPNIMFQLPGRGVKTVTPHVGPAGGL
jgi:hypothetical protein